MTVPGKCDINLCPVCSITSLILPRVVMLPTFSSLVAPEVDVMTRTGATSDDKVGMIAILGFQFAWPTGKPQLSEIWRPGSLTLYTQSGFNEFKKNAPQTKWNHYCDYYQRNQKEWDALVFLSGDNALVLQKSPNY